MISFGIIHLDPSDVHFAKSIIRGSGAFVVDTRKHRNPDSVVIFSSSKKDFNEVIESISERISSISRVSEIRNIRPVVIDSINPESFELPKNIHTGIFESANLEVIISSANAISMLDEVTIIQIILSGNSNKNSRLILAGDEKSVDESINTAIAINRSTGRVIEKYERENRSQ
ncbi:MAG: hypothetical protein R2883_01905 [Caldisericia bacterium]